MLAWCHIAHLLHPSCTVTPATERGSVFPLRATCFSFAGLRYVLLPARSSTIQTPDSFRSHYAELPTLPETTKTSSAADKE
jgi:hypothetical protein